MLTRIEPGVAGSFDGVGDRRPSIDVQRVVLRDGSSVVIRLLAAGDEAAIPSWFASCFAELDAVTLYARQVALLKRLDPRAEPGLARVDRIDHEAVVAIAPDGVTVGIARCLRCGSKPGSAEVTIAVSEAWRERGIASMLLDRLAARARSIGIEQLTASCAADSHTVMRLLSRLGPITTGRAAAGLVDARINLNSA
jgi:L-amino acid N-acyltransferase YncA